MLYLNHKLTINGFDSSEVLKIKAKNLFEASRILGVKTRELTLSTLKKTLIGKDKKKQLKKCEKELELIQHFSQKGSFTIDGVNYAKRYIEALSGFSEGVGISLTEAAFLQKEIEPGCQTMITRNENGDLAFLHTEENAADDNTLPGYNYRMVVMKLPKKEVAFFTYPGICGWGSAFGLDRTNNFVQLADDLMIDSKHSGEIWSNMITFMVFDTGGVEKTEELIKKIAPLGRKHGYLSGYSVHVLGYKKEAGFASFEFGGKILRKANNFSKIFAQVNYSNIDDLKKMADFYPTKNLKNWSKWKQMDFYEMTRREARLLALGKMGLWKTNTTDKAIKTGLKVLAYPHGDLRKYKSKNGKNVFYHTGLPSRWTFAHFVGYVGKFSRFYIGKKTPAPIKGMEYSNEIDENYKYAEEKLWKL